MLHSIPVSSTEMTEPSKYQSYIQSHLKLDFNIMHPNFQVVFLTLVFSDQTYDSLLCDSLLLLFSFLLFFSNDYNVS